MAKKVTWGELKNKIDELVEDDDIIHHIILVSSEGLQINLDDLEVWGNNDDYGKVIQNNKKRMR